ncbi:MAG: hypothetical protein J6Z00_04210 [Clostridia bacterium]|nr:hypothetical protein [Clostridia bacterium]
MEKITHKSRKEMTMDDIEKAINKVIDDGELEKYSKKVTDITASKELSSTSVTATPTPSPA